jgi:two-component system sensor histidine kinase CpxA
MRIRTLYFKVLLSFFLVLIVAGMLPLLFFGKQGVFLVSPWELAAVSVAAAVLAVPVSRRLTRRIESLETSVNRIAEGDFHHRVSVRGEDEIKDLGLALNRMAERLEKMVQGSKELTANVSHELRRPLTRIRLSADLMAEELHHPGEGDPSRHLEKIRTDLGEMERLIQRALLLSRADIKGRSVDKVTMDAFDVLAEILEKIQPVIVQKSLQYRSDLPSRIPPLYGDRDGLRAVLSNVFENAVKFVPEKGQVLVKAEVQDGEVQVEVTNSHPPVPEDELARLFDPFYRAASSTVSGSGLGLAIAKKVIMAQGGTIEALNVDRGFMIRIRLPLRAD